MGLTLYDKLWARHLVHDYGDGTGLLYVDRQILHEVSSPQGFEGLRAAGRKVRRPAAHLAVADHAVPTRGRGLPIADLQARAQVALLEANAAEAGVRYIPLTDVRQGIVHVIGPELGFTQPGLTLVCGDSHTSTHGAFGALAFGVGSSECEVVLATQTLRQTRAKTYLVEVTGALSPGVTPKDLILGLFKDVSGSRLVRNSSQPRTETRISIQGSRSGTMTRASRHPVTAAPGDAAATPPAAPAATLANTPRRVRPLTRPDIPTGAATSRPRESGRSGRRP